MKPDFDIVVCGGQTGCEATLNLMDSLLLAAQLPATIENKQTSGR